jgi:hypothetical protein
MSMRCYESSDDIPCSCRSRFVAAPALPGVPSVNAARQRGSALKARAKA